jgi:hypothetical protein
MKRSEMIDNIARVLVSKSPYPQAIDINKIVELSGKILDELENRGMIPPFYFCMHPSTPESTPFGSCKLHKWEPE